MLGDPSLDRSVALTRARDTAVRPGELLGAAIAIVCCLATGWFSWWISQERKPELRAEMFRPLEAAKASLYLILVTNDGDVAAHDVRVGIDGSAGVILAEPDPNRWYVATSTQAAVSRAQGSNSLRPHRVFDELPPKSSALVAIPVQSGSMLRPEAVEVSCDGGVEVTVWRSPFGMEPTR